MATAVVMGAKLQCTCGDAPSDLVVTTHGNNLIENKLAATIMDHKPAVNILPFGTCKTLTANASGTPTPCVPATSAPWTVGAVSQVLVANQLGLLNTDKLMCNVGGMISVTDAGQQSTTDT